MRRDDGSNDDMWTLCSSSMVLSSKSRNDQRRPAVVRIGLQMCRCADSVGICSSACRCIDAVGMQWRCATMSCWGMTSCILQQVHKHGGADVTYV